MEFYLLLQVVKRIFISFQFTDVKSRSHDCNYNVPIYCILPICMFSFMKVNSVVVCPITDHPKLIFLPSPKVVQESAPYTESCTSG